MKKSPMIIPINMDPTGSCFTYFRVRRYRLWKKQLKRRAKKTGITITFKKEPHAT